MRIKPGSVGPTGPFVATAGRQCEQALLPDPAVEEVALVCTIVLEDEGLVGAALDIE